MSEEPDGQLDHALEILRAEAGVDFRGYKRGLLLRRLEQRAAMRHTTVPQYLDRLASDPEETRLLISAMRLKVTRFFRDPDTWGVIGDRVLPRLVDAAGDRRTLYAWSAGCATGQEAYSLAMTLGESLADHPGWDYRVWATNIDEPALAQAATGIYSPAQLGGLSPDRVARWMTPSPEGKLQFREDLRRKVTFTGHDLFSPGVPVDDVDLILCRNVIMFFEKDAQRRVLSTLHHALAPGGMLVLGPGEYVPAVMQKFWPFDSRHHIYAAAGAH
jgi:two-component system CheB/CheR fusion protein